MESLAKLGGLSYIRQQHGALSLAMKQGWARVYAKGVPSDAVLSLLRTLPALLDNIEHLEHGLHLIAKHANSACVDCKASQRLATVILAGGKLESGTEVADGVRDGLPELPVGSADNGPSSR